ncbi:hypothetical protein SAMN03080606_00851 [Alkaliphilus peptidifermentans DSM 18978]|uniref:Uncharacterized protein n=1 Tax=Alkaliphilus peptidifermentans DSM 18978 TaxID=1120976 RepID=A0A1G5DBC0_9FIRM|nr:hypothetical protein SAMN03080606_00851 [Alkaliphilus peptidifermentans DSM 18978]
MKIGFKLYSMYIIQLDTIIKKIYNKYKSWCILWVLYAYKFMIFVWVTYLLNEIVTHCTFKTK